MSNVISFDGARTKKENKKRKELNPLEHAKEILASNTPVKKNTLFKDIKGILRSRKVEYRITFKEIDLTGYDKNSVIIFPKYKIVFVFSEQPVVFEEKNCWFFEPIKLDRNKKAVDYVSLIMARLEELNEDGTEKRKK